MIVKKDEMKVSIHRSVAIRKAYDRLPLKDKTRITRLSLSLVRAVKERNPAAQFDFYDAREVLAKIGIWMVRCKHEDEG